MQKISDYISSKSVRYLLYALGAVIAFCIVFQLGVIFGLHHPPRWDFHGAQNQPGNSMHGRFGFPHQMMPHGVPDFVGYVTDTSLPIITAQSRDGDSIKITVSSSTIIRSGRRYAETPIDADAGMFINKGAMIVVIGEHPDNNEDAPIDAKFIRILTLPPTSK